MTKSDIIQFVWLEFSFEWNKFIFCRSNEPNKLLVLFWKWNLYLLYLKFCVQFILHLGLLGKKSRRSLNEDKYKLNSKASKKVIFKKKYFFTVEDISPNIG